MIQWPIARLVPMRSAFMLAWFMDEAEKTLFDVNPGWVDCPTNKLVDVFGRKPNELKGHFKDLERYVHIKGERKDRKAYVALGIIEEDLSKLTRRKVAKKIKVAKERKNASKKPKRPPLQPAPQARPQTPPEGSGGPSEGSQTIPT